MAVHLVAEHPVLAAKIGSPAVAEHRVEAALLGLVALDVRVPAMFTDDEALALVRHLTAAGVGAKWTSRFSPVLVAGADPQTCVITAWAHLMPGARQQLRTGYANLLKQRVARSAPDVRLPPPSPPDGGPEVVPIPDGCLICGRSQVPMSAVEVARAGGRQRAAEQVWTPQLVFPTALGGRRSPRLLSGHLCVDCAEATASVGSIGPTSLIGPWWLPCDLLGQTFGVDVGGVDHVHPGFEEMSICCRAAFTSRWPTGLAHPVPPKPVVPRVGASACGPAGVDAGAGRAGRPAAPLTSAAC